MLTRFHARVFALMGLMAAPLLLLVAPTRAAQAADAESATHAFEAASYQVKDTYQFPDFKVIQFELGVLSHYSYLLVSGQGLVVDPGRD